jgi:uncharacterized protein YjiS (DUF1127 family)
MTYATINEVRIRNGGTTVHPQAMSARFLAALRVWRQRARDRAELSRLTARDARDLGIDPGVIAYEASKPFWKA